MSAEVETLDARKQLAALMVAKGAKRADVARAVGVTETSVSRWKSNAAFAAEVDRFSRLDVERLGALARVAQVEWIDAGKRALAKLVELLDATDDEGDPVYGVQVQAAREIRQGMTELGGFRQISSDDESGGARAAAAAVIHIHRDGEGGTTIRAGADTIEGEATEVVE